LQTKGPTRIHGKLCRTQAEHFIIASSAYTTLLLRRIYYNKFNNDWKCPFLKTFDSTSSKRPVFQVKCKSVSNMDPKGSTN